MRIPPWRFRPMVSSTIMITGRGILFECLLSEALFYNSSNVYPEKDRLSFYYIILTEPR